MLVGYNQYPRLRNTFDLLLCFVLGKSQERVWVVLGIGFNFLIV